MTRQITLFDEPAFVLANSAVEWIQRHWHGPRSYQEIRDRIEEWSPGDWNTVAREAKTPVPGPRTIERAIEVLRQREGTVQCLPFP